MFHFMFYLSFKRLVIFIFYLTQSHWEINSTFLENVLYFFLGIKNGLHEHKKKFRLTLHAFEYFFIHFFWRNCINQQYYHFTFHKFVHMPFLLHQHQHLKYWALWMHFMVRTWKLLIKRLDHLYLSNDFIYWSGFLYFD